MTIRLVLLLLALICFVLAAADIKAPRINLMAAGLALWVLSLIVPY